MAEAFLKKAECHFNWHLSGFEKSSITDRLKKKLADPNRKTEGLLWWAYKLTLSYELFLDNAAEAEKLIEEVIQGLVKSTEDENKYRVAFLHIALSDKAFMMLKNGNRSEVETLIKQINPILDMTDVEKSGLLAAKAKIFRSYGPDGVVKTLPLLREAVKLNPVEVQWKIQLVSHLRYIRTLPTGREVEWKDIEETVVILQGLLRRPDISPDEIVSCKYQLAHTYYNFVKGKKFSPITSDYWKRITRLCEEFCEQTDNPTYLMFATARFVRSQCPRLRNRGMKMLEKSLEKFPTKVSLNTFYSQLLIKQREYARALKYSEMAMEGGGYGGWWQWLECKTKLNEEVDCEEFFNKILSEFEAMYKVDIHLNAALHYFFFTKKLVNGALHIEEALQDRQSDQPFKPHYFHPFGVTIKCPIELAYNQIVLALRTHQSLEDSRVLRRVKSFIERVTDTARFPTDRDLIEEILNNRR